MLTRRVLFPKIGHLIMSGMSSWICRQQSQYGASCSLRPPTSTACRALLGTQNLDHEKLCVTFMAPVHANGPRLPSSRRYTLTHSDITGLLRLSVGQSFNQLQLSGWYLRLIRDEVLAEWKFSEDRSPELHLFCHISGGGYLPFPASLRSHIFQREMPLVLRAIKHADAEFLSREQLLAAAVVVHLSSHIQELHTCIQWGILGEEVTWKKQGLAWYEIWWRRLVPSIKAAQHQTMVTAAAEQSKQQKMRLVESAESKFESPVAELLTVARLEPRSHEGAAKVM